MLFFNFKPTKLKYFSFLFLFIISLLVHSQHLYKVSADEKCGFIDAKGKVVIASVFSSCQFDYDYDLAAVRNEQGYHLMNAKGEVISPLVYDTTYVFNSRFLIGVKGNRVGVYERNKGIVSLRLQADSALPFVHFEKIYLQVFDAGQTFLIDNEGRSYFKNLAIDKITNISENHFLLEQNRKKGIYTLSGTSYLNIKYDSIIAYKGGLKYYQGGKLGYKKKLFYLTSSTGQAAFIDFPAEYDDISYFGKDYLVLRKEKALILYHIKDRKIITRNFNENARPLCEEYHKYRSQGKFGLCNLLGTPLSEPLYNRLIDSKHPNRVIYIKNGQYGFMDEKGQELTNLLFDKISPFKEKGIVPRSFTKYKVNGLFGLVDINGDTTVAPKFTSIQLVSNDRAACVNADSSGRVYMMDTQTGLIDDWYDLIDIKQLSVSKKYYRTGTDNLFVAITPFEKGYYSYKILNRKNWSEEADQYNLRDLAMITINKINVNRSNTIKLIFKSQLNDKSFAPIDVKVSALSVSSSGKRKVSNSSSYQSMELIDDFYVKARKTNGDISFFDVNLRRLKLLYQENNRKYSLPVHQAFVGNHYYPNVFKVDFFENDTNYVVLKNDLKSFEVGIGFDTLLFNHRFIYGRSGEYWQCANIDSLQLPNQTFKLSFNDSLLLSTQKKTSFYIYGRNGNQTHRLGTLEVINQSKDGITLLKIDSVFNYLNSRGEFLLADTIKEAYPFVNGFANIKIGDEYGVINRAGELVINNQKRKLVFNALGVAKKYENRKCYLIDTFGNNVDTMVYTSLSAIKYSTLFAYKLTKSDKWGLLNSSGEVLYHSLFDKVKSIDSGLILGLNGNQVKLINAHDGRELIDIKGAVIKKANQGVYLVNKGSKWGMFSDKGKWILPMKYSRVSKFNSSGFAIATSKKGVFYVLSDYSITGEKPKRKSIKPKPSQIILLPKDNEQYVGVLEASIPARYHEIVRLKNGCYIGRRFHQYIVHTIKGQEVIHSDLWVSAQLIDNEILEVMTTESVNYFNLNTLQWVWGNIHD